MSPDKRAARTEVEPTTPPEGVSPAIRVMMMPRDTNANGTIFGGVILAQIDLAAAIEAHRWHPGRLATVAMDKIEFKRPVFVGDLVSFYTSTEHTGTTSVTIRVDVWAQRRHGSNTRVPVTSATVTMVATDEGGQKVPLANKVPSPLY
ncbi:acyl-CoA thioesterase [Engelhardtia mirabilis]|uniref:Putative acyl-CoA thioester hydrolase n=1 Tax=Engelhardtia mirabilis TaxID=2528011 RepID=A0A518BSC8_9BACT|nr:putative acyl-CoA thioester hydrolase [Planctomycetes bacterium Pla133]QDV04203.1 putative acyl-CoA thioester hydrolase [Planctomycetes bacterium Pla86]